MKERGGGRGGGEGEREVGREKGRWARGRGGGQGEGEVGRGEGRWGGVGVFVKFVRALYTVHQLGWVIQNTINLKPRLV